MTKAIAKGKRKELKIISLQVLKLSVCGAFDYKEYLTAETLNLANNTVQDNKKSHIIPQHLQLAIRSLCNVSLTFVNAGTNSSWV